MISIPNLFCLKLVYQKYHRKNVVAAQSGKKSHAQKIGSKNNFLHKKTVQYEV